MFRFVDLVRLFRHVKCIVPDCLFLVPLFWGQPGYSLKPAPVLSPDRTHAQNLDAIRRHFTKTVTRYGPHVRFHFPILSLLKCD